MFASTSTGDASARLQVTPPSPVRATCTALFPRALEFVHATANRVPESEPVICPTLKPDCWPKVAGTDQVWPLSEVYAALMLLSCCHVATIREPSAEMLAASFCSCSEAVVTRVLAVPHVTPPSVEVRARIEPLPEDQTTASVVPSAEMTGA